MLHPPVSGLQNLRLLLSICFGCQGKLYSKLYRTASNVKINNNLFRLVIFSYLESKSLVKAKFPMFLSHCDAGQYEDAFIGKWPTLNKFTYRREPFIQNRVIKINRDYDLKECVKRNEIPKPTKFIANNNGWLLPNVKKDTLKPAWGEPDIKHWVWERDDACMCRPKSHKSIFNGARGELPKYFCDSPPKVCCTKQMSNKCENSQPKEQLWEVFFAQFKELKIPVIWNFGYPDEKFKEKRKQFVHQLAKLLHFSVINMEKVIPNWNKRVRAILNLSTEKERIKYIEKLAKIDQEKIVCYCKYPILLESGPSRLQRLFDASKLVQNTIQTKNGKFPTEVIVLLLSFAMLDRFPANGYIIDYFPFERKEAHLFENVLYPLSAGIYFCSSKGKDKDCKRVNFDENCNIIDMSHIFQRESEHSNDHLNSLFEEEYKDDSVKVLSPSKLNENNIEHLNKAIITLLKEYLDHLSKPNEKATKKYIGAFLDKISTFKIDNFCFPSSLEKSTVAEERIERQKRKLEKKKKDDEKAEERKVQIEILREKLKKRFSHLIHTDDNDNGVSYATTKSNSSKSDSNSDSNLSTNENTEEDESGSENQSSGSSSKTKLSQKSLACGTTKLELESSNYDINMNLNEK